MLRLVLSRMDVTSVAFLSSIAVNGVTVFPDFSDSSKGYTDFNDYFAHEATV